MGKLSPTNVSIIRYTKQFMSIGGVAHTNGQQDKTIVKFLSSEEMAEFAGEVQQKTREETTQPDVTISIYEDASSGNPAFGSDKFSGFMVNSNYSGSTTSAGVTVGALHEDSLMGQFIGSAYDLPWQITARQNNAEDSEQGQIKMLAKAVENSSSVGEMVKACVDVLYKGFDGKINWGRARDSFGDDIQSVATQQHQGNKKPYETLSKILESDSSASGWSEFFAEIGGKDAQSIREAIGKTISGMITSKSTNFMGNLDSILSMFGCCYCPPPRGSESGRIVRIQESLLNPKSLSVDDLCSVQFRTGSSMAIPVTQVFMSTASVQAARQATTSLKYFLTYPEGARKGRGSMSVERPPWMASLSLPNELTTEQLKRDTPPAKKIESGIQSNEDNWKQVEGTKKKQNKLLTEYLRSRYYEVTLGGSEAVLTMPYYFPQEVMDIGTTYQVKNKKGSVIFTGFLDSLVYTLGTDGTCTREAHFSYVQAGNFKLEE